MSVDGEFRKLLVAATAMAIVALLAPTAGATERQTDGWLHGAEAPAAAEATDGRLHSTEAKVAAEVTDGWLHSMQAPVATDVTDGWASSGVRYEAPDGAPRVEVARSVTDGWLHSNLVETQRPPEVARTAGSSGISIEVATGMSVAALLIGFGFAALVISRRSRQVNPA